MLPRHIVYLLALLILQTALVACKGETRRTNRGQPQTSGTQIPAPDTTTETTTTPTAITTPAEAPTNEEAKDNTSEEGEQLDDIAMSLSNLTAQPEIDTKVTAQPDIAALTDTATEGSDSAEVHSQIQFANSRSEEINLNTDVAEVDMSHYDLTPDIVLHAIKQANGTTMSVDRAKMKESAGAFVLGTSLSTFPGSPRPVAQFLLKVKEQNNQTRYVIVKTNLVVDKTIVGQLQRSQLLNPNSRLEVLDFATKKQIENKQYQSQIQVASLCTVDCEQIVLLLSLVDGKGKVFASVSSVFEAVPGQSQMALLYSSLDKNTRSFKQGLQIAEAAIEQQRKEMAVAALFAKEAENAPKAKIAKLTGEMRKLESEIAVQVAAYGQSETARQAELNNANSKMTSADLQQWAEANYLLSVEVTTNRLRVIEIKKQIEALENILAQQSGRNT